MSSAKRGRRSGRNSFALRYLLFVNLLSLAGFNVFAPLYAVFARGFEVPTRDIGLIWSVYSLSMAVFILIFGRLENGWHKGRAMVTGYFLYALGAASLLLVHNERTLLAAMLFNSLGSGVALPVYKTLFARMETSGRESEQWSWLDAGTQIAAALGAAAGGVIVAAYGFRGVFITMAAVQLLAAIVAWHVFYRHA